MDDNTKAIASVTVAVGIVVVGAVNYFRAMRVEKIKRAKIATWEQENIGCIKNSTARLQQIANDPTLSFEDFVAAWNEEIQFLNIVQSQPMY